MGILSFLVFIAVLGVGIVIPVLPFYATEFGATTVELGLVFSALSISRLLGVLFIGGIADKFGKKKFIILGLLIYLVSSLLYICANDVVDLVWTRVLQGIGSSMIVPLAIAYVGELAPRGKEGFYMGLINTSFFLGLSGGPIISGLLVKRWGIGSAFWGMTFFTFLALLLALFFLPASKGSAVKKVDLFGVFNVILSDRNCLAVFSMGFAMDLSRAIVMTFLPLIAHLRGMEYDTIGMLVGLFLALTAIIQGPFGRLADKISKRKLIVSVNLMYALLLLVIPFIDGDYGFFSMIVLMGVAAGAAYPALSAIMTEIGRVKGMALSMSILQVANSAGMSIGPILSGEIQSLFGFKAAFVCGSMALFVGVLLVLTSHKLGYDKG